MDGRDQQKGRESQKTHEKKFLLRVGGSGKVKGHATTQLFHTGDAYVCRSAKSCVQSTELYVNIKKAITMM